MAKKEKIKLIYIMGAARSGSTILDNVLAQAKGFFTVGEASFVWTRGVFENRFCGCGKRFNRCKFWTRVFKKVYGGVAKKDARLMQSILKTYSLDKLPIMFKIKTPKLCWAIQYLDRLYKTVAEISGCNVIVDSSKWPLYGVLLSQLPSVDLLVINLVRDPRAVAYSWTKKKKYEPFGKENIYMKRQSATGGALEWIVWNFIAGIFKKRVTNKLLFVRYEDFARNPCLTIKKILKLIGEEDKKILLRGHRINMRKNHSVSGNPVRFKKGQVEIKIDDKWKDKLSRKDKLVVSGLSLPFILLYGYRL